MKRHKGTAISFGMLLNLAAVANCEDPRCCGVFCAAMRRTPPREIFPRLDRMIGYAVVYFRDFVKPKKVYRAADEVERAALENLPPRWDAARRGQRRRGADPALRCGAADPALPEFGAKGATPERPGVSNDWFNMLYQVLLGEDRGPRFGSFAALYGVDNTRALIADALAGKFLKPDAA